MRWPPCAPAAAGTTSAARASRQSQRATVRRVRAGTLTGCGSRRPGRRERGYMRCAAYTPPVDDTGFQGRVALVTGGSGGIGKALSARLAAEGAAVAVHYAANREPAEAVVRSIIAAGGRAVALGADLRDAAATERLVDEVERELG